MLLKACIACPVVVALMFIKVDLTWAVTVVALIYCRLVGVPAACMCLEY